MELFTRETIGNYTSDPYAKNDHKYSKEMQEVEIVIAPSLLTEGKVYQKAQQLGMGK